ncbi:unnamed protein product [Vicia faba]|uniref:Reverse transcriptase domain-containing protein n=1 Tax=Vicia faba TaxID=3906 RepID=A0AAV0ZBG3_VICFA|nr:unnamed protein product [Vicia faba]
MKHAQTSHLITGIKDAKTAPNITHLLFADDSLIFCQDTTKEARNLSKIFQKIFLTFLLSDPIQHCLGLPTQINKSRNQSFGYIVDRIRDKLQSWKEKTLSYAGIVTLIKSIAQAIPKSLVLIIAISITIGTLYLVFRPKLPKYSVDRLRIAQFNLSKSF